MPQQPSTWAGTAGDGDLDNANNYSPVGIPGLSLTIAKSGVQNRVMPSKGSCSKSTTVGSGGTIGGTCTFSNTVTVQPGGKIQDGTFNGDVTNNGNVSGGTFNGAFNDNNPPSQGTFNGTVYTNGEQGVDPSRRILLLT